MSTKKRSTEKRSEKRRPIFIDSSPLLLLLVGAYDENLIGRFKRVDRYSRNDFNLLVQFLVKRRVLVTPGVLAEVSNLAMELGLERFQRLVDHNIEGLKKMGESHVAKNIILEAPEFKKVGATDTSLVVAAKEGDGEILTADHPLCSRCRTMKIPVTHMMELEWRGEQFF